MLDSASFQSRLDVITRRYLAEVASPKEYLSVLRWQIAEGHHLDRRDTLPGHVTTSAIVLSPDHQSIMLIDHIQIGRWLQPGGHYETSERFHLSAEREAVEETGVTGLRLHPWHKGNDIPFVMDSHDVPGNPRRGEVEHMQHDLQYLFLADPTVPLRAQVTEVHSAAWHPIAALADVSPKAAQRLKDVPILPLPF